MRRRFRICGLLGAFFSVVLCSLPVYAQIATNIILFIGDGMGPEQVRAGAYFKGTNLVFESWARFAEVTTYPAGGGVTDSAAAATAMATGHKVYNGVISVAAPGDGHKLETVLEYLQRQGKRVGLVTTTTTTHATPAAFAAHASSRYDTLGIAADYLERTRPNVLFGGGSGFNAAEAESAGYTVVTNRVEMLALSTASETRVAGLFGRGDMPYVFDGVGDLPHLSEMTQVALEILDDEPDGFFLVVEGGRIDHACHANNINQCVREVVEFDNAVTTAVAWAEGRTDTLVLVTADHETGGLHVLTNNGAGQEPTVTWSTGGHTITNVGVYAFGPGTGAIAGVLDNTEIYRIMMRSQPMVPVSRGIAMVSGGKLATRWDAKPGVACRLVATDNLVEPDWATVGSITALTHVVTLVDTNTAAWPRRFYRLEYDE